MIKKLILIFIGLAFLMTVLLVGTPFEFLNVTADAIASFAYIVLFLFLFIFLYKKILKLNSKVFKWTTFGILTLIAIPYFFIGMWTTLNKWNQQPMWQDLIIYRNENDQKVIGEWRRTSGSIYDYRDRKIIADYGQFRISFDCNVDNLKGVWEKYDIREDTTTTINFNKK